MSCVVTMSCISRSQCRACGLNSSFYRNRVDAYLSCLIKELVCNDVKSWQLRTKMRFFLIENYKFYFFQSCASELRTKTKFFFDNCIFVNIITLKAALSNFVQRRNSLSTIINCAYELRTKKKLHVFVRKINVYCTEIASQSLNLRFWFSKICFSFSVFQKFWCVDNLVIVRRSYFMTFH
jgi:hypothetical protein